MAAGKRAGSSKKRVKKNIPEGVVFIYSTFNNTIVTISDKQGNVYLLPREMKSDYEKPIKVESSQIH